jgi:amidohydrolase
MLMGAAMLLKDIPFDGEIRLLFQPAEEQRLEYNGVSGAPRMIRDGAIEGLDAVIALHVDGTLDRGKISISPGYIGANSDRVYAKVIGKGGHGAMPNDAIDPIFMMGPILTALHGIVSRRVKPIEPAVLTIGLLQGGTVDNVIPGEVELELTLRSVSAEVRDLLIEEVEKALSIAKALGGTYEIRTIRGYPALYNDPEVAGWFKTTGTDLLGVTNVVVREPSMGGEDFAFMAQASKGAMMNLGVKEPQGEPRYVHHPQVDLDEEALPIGAAMLAETALRFVRGEYR